MRRLIAVATLVALALMLTACGGGGEPAADQPAEATAPAPPPSAAAEEVKPDRSPSEGQVYEPFPTDPEVVPKEILDRLEEGQSMLLYFYDGDQSTTKQQTEAVDEVMKDYPGLIDELRYDVGKYVVTGTDGSITLDQEALMEVEDQPAEEQNAQMVAQLLGSEWLDVTFSPYIIFTDADGYITYRIRGPVDSKILEGQVLRVAD